MRSDVKNEEKAARENIINHIYNEYYPWLLKRAYGRVHDKSICEDLFNDCVVNWVKHMEKLEQLPENELRAYVLKTMDNVCINYLKKASRVIIMSDEEAGKLLYIEDQTQNIEEYIEEKYNYEVVMKSFRKLSEREQEIICMKYKKRMKDRDIAPIIGVKENSVRMTVRRCVEKLSKIVKEEMDDCERV